jgi:putative acetyltransferase
LTITYRNITPEDNAPLAAIIRNGIEQLGLPTEGTAHSDPTTDDLFSHFKKFGSAYIVVEANGEVMGGCGIYPTDGLPGNYAELVRFFLHESARGKNIGKHLMRECEKLALTKGYTHLYLESFPDMKAAIHLYETFGYSLLNEPIGNSGHYACNVWMLKELE